MVAGLVNYVVIAAVDSKGGNFSYSYNRAESEIPRLNSISAPFPPSGPDRHDWPQVKHLEVALHYIMTDVIDVWELLSPLKNHSHNICLH